MVPMWYPRRTNGPPLGDEPSCLLIKNGVGDGSRTRDFLSHSQWTPFFQPFSPDTTSPVFLIKYQYLGHKSLSQVFIAFHPSPVYRGTYVVPMLAP